MCCLKGVPCAGEARGLERSGHLAQVWGLGPYLGFSMGCMAPRRPLAPGLCVTHASLGAGGVNFGPSEGLCGGSSQVGEAGPRHLSPWVPEAASALQTEPGRRPASALRVWPFRLLWGLLGQLEGEVPSFPDECLWLTAGSVMKIKSHSKQEKCVYILFSTCLGFRHISSVRVLPRNCMCIGSGVAEHPLCAAPALAIWGPFQPLTSNAAGNFL